MPIVGTAAYVQELSLHSRARNCGFLSSLRKGKLPAFPVRLSRMPIFEHERASTLAIAACLLCVLLAYWIFRRSPLDAAPSIHWSARFSSIWLRWHRLLDTDTLAVHRAHLRHGAVVRLAPNELSVCDADTGLKPIYEGRLPKTDWYRIAISYGTAPSFALKDEESHRRRKRMTAKPYMNSYMRSNPAWQAQQERLTDELHAALQDLSKDDRAVDFNDVVFAWSLAVISYYVFGSKGAIDLLGDLKEARTMQTTYTKERLAGVWLTSWPALPQKLLRWMGYSTESSCIADMRERADRSPDNACEEKATHERPTPFEFMKSEMLGNASGKADEAAIVTKDQQNILYSEVQDHIVAGLDTSQITMIICIWLLTLERNRVWQGRIRAEITQSRQHGSASDVASPSVPDAILKETMRLYPTVAGCLPRMTDKPIVLGPADRQVSVPVGTTVHSQAWTLHRNPTVFPNPEEWRPERWLDSPPEQMKEMEKWFWAFGSGSRRCIGESLAMSSMRTALAAIYGDFETLETEHTKLEMHFGNFLLPGADREGNVLRLLVRKVPD